MAKEKKKKAKKPGKAENSGGAKAVATLKSLADNPLVADVVAAALVATASALKDSNRARALASDAGDELDKLSKAGSERGSALWDMALQIGRRSLEAITAEQPRPAKPKSSAKVEGAKPKAPKKAKSAARKKSASAAKG